MQLGSRPIRSSGKGSGSVEVTLPAELRPMAGLMCSVWLHDGARPDIVLRPDMGEAHAAFVTFWSRLCRGLAAHYPHVDAALPFPADNFFVAVLPRQDAPAAPSLCWADGMLLARNAACALHVARIAGACMMQMAPDLDIRPDLAGLFGAACGVFCGGAVPFPEWHEAADLAAAALPDGVWQPGAAWRDTADWQADRFWHALSPGLAALTAQFQRWSPPDSPLLELRSAWRRGSLIEFSRG